MDSDALAYIAAVETADGMSLPKHIKNAINEFVTGCKKDESPISGVSNWDAIKSACFLAGPRTRQAAMIPLKGPSLSNVGFVDSDYHTAKGLKGNGSTKYLRTGLFFGDFPSLENVSLSVYTTEHEGTENIEVLAGRTSGGGSRFHIRSTNATVKNNFIAISNSFTVPETVAGFSGGSRHNTSITTARYGGIEYTSTVSPAIGVGSPTDSLNVFAQQNGNQNTNARISWYHYGESVDLLALENRIKTYMNEIKNGFDEDAIEYINNVELADGMPLPDRVKKAINNFVVGCKSDSSPFEGVSNWDAMKATFLFAGPRTSSGSLVPLKGKIFGVNGTFSNDQHNTLTGLKPIWGEYIELDLTLDQFQVGNMSMSYHCTEVTEPSSVIFGSDNAGTGSSNIGRGFNTNEGTIGFRCQTSLPRNITYISPLGFKAVNRVDTNGVTAYTDDESAYFPVSSQELSSNRVFLFRLSSSMYSSSDRVSFAQIGDAVNQVLLKNRINEYLEEIADGLDPDAIDYINRVELTEGYKLPDHVVNAIDAFVKGCKADASPMVGVSNWDAIKASCFLAGPRTLNGALVPLKGNTPTNNSFVSDDYHSVIGLKGDGSNKSLSSNHYGNEFDRINLSLSVYTTEPEGDENQVLAGILPGTQNRFCVRSVNATSKAFYPGSGTNTTVPSKEAGFFGGSRHLESSAKGFYGNTLYSANNTAHSSDIPSSNFPVFRSTSGSFTTARISFYHIGEAVDLELLNSRITAYMSAITNGFDADAQDYINRVELVQKEDLEKHIKKAINKFVSGCKQDPSPMPGVSNWDAIKTCCLLAGPQTLSGVLVPLKGVSPTSNGFIQSDYDTLTGLKGDNGNKRLNTHRSGTDDPQDNCHLAIFLTEPNSAPASGSAGFAGQVTDVSTPQRGIFRHTGVKANSSGWHGAFSTNTVGFIGVSRHDPEFSLGLYSNNLTSMPLQSTDPSPNEIAIFARAVGGQTGTNMRCSFYSAGESVDLELLEYRVSTYMRQIRGVNTHLLLLAHSTLNINGAL